MKAHSQQITDESTALFESSLQDQSKSKEATEH
jgi:hypothetical protein